MNRDQKRTFIRELVQNTEASVLEMVDRMPEEWDGHQLRQYLADCFARNVAASFKANRKRDYANEILIRNL